MQTTPDGEYIPTKELNKNFKIPKKKPKIIIHSDQIIEAAPVMQDPHCNNFIPDASVLPASLLMAPPPPPPPPAEPDYQLQAAQSIILQNLQQQHIEKPKTYSNYILQDTIPDLFDETLPRELTTQFQPLFCKLCSAQLSSNIVAKLHYKCKNHEKKLKKFLIEYSERTGTPLHPRAKLPIKMKEHTGDVNPLYFYCDVCDLPLTGKLHAESHYMGKNHKKAVLGGKKPAGKGHYDSNGKWIRESKKRPLEEDDSFGADFRQSNPEAPPVIGVACYPPPTTSGFRCEVCNITTTCQEQLQCHYNGQKHKKKLKQYNLTLGPNFDPNLMIPQEEIAAAQVVQTCPVEVAAVVDVSVYRTPSGQFYCPTCNTTMSSEMQFKQHLQGKSHLKKAIEKNK